MKTLHTILLILVAPFVMAMNQTMRPEREACWNGLDPTPHATGRIGRYAESDFARTCLLVKKGVAAGSMALCDAASEPIGPCMDSPETGERGTVLHLGATPGTMTMIASKAIAETTRVYATAGGKITDAVVSGAYLVGKTVEAAAGDDAEVEVVPCFPVVNP